MTAHTLTKLCIEHPIPVKDEEKLPYSFDGSEDRYTRKHYHRHFFPHEAMALKAKFLDNDLPPEQKPAVLDMLTGDRELYHTAIEAMDNYLLIIDSPKLSLQEKRYVNLRPQQRADGAYIGDLPKNKEIPVSELAMTNEELVQRLWSARYEELHPEIRKSAYLIIPSEGIWPLARSQQGFKFGLEPALRAGSRGIKLETGLYEPVLMKAYAPAYENRFADLAACIGK